MSERKKGSEVFDAYYFAHGCGRPYRRDPEWLAFFGSIADRIVVEINPRTALDAGCAMGFLVEALRERGVEAYGVDISEYAISQVHPNIREYCWVGSVTDPLPQQYDLIVCIEVLEHLEPAQAEAAIANLCQYTEDILFSSSPTDHKEATHLNVRPIEYWVGLFARHGFFRDLDFDATFITPWAVRLRKVRTPVWRVVAGYERHLVRLQEGYRQKTDLALEQRGELARLNQELMERDIRLKALQEEVHAWQERWADLQRGMTWRALAFIQHLVLRLAPLGSRRRRILEVAERALSIWLREGFLALIRTAWARLRLGWLRGHRQAPRVALEQESYEAWVRQYDTLSETDLALAAAHLASLPYQPLISVVMPVYNTPVDLLRRAIDSVRAQVYPNWELCIADDASTDPGVREVLLEAQAADSRIKVALRPSRGHISAASNTALELARGEFIALMDHDDEIPPHALYMVAVELNQSLEADILYSDEDKIDERGLRFDPYFKPDWNPELFLAQNVITHLGVYRTRLVREVGGFREGYEGAQDWDLAMRVIERIPASHIRHIPHVLYHWRVTRGSAARSVGEKPYAIEAQRRLLVSHFERIGEAAEVIPLHGGRWRVRYPLPAEPPLVSIIVPTRNSVRVLSRCIDSVLDKSTYPNFELVILDNRSDDPRTLQYLEALSRRPDVRVVRYDQPFNYSAINNFGARHAKGEVLVFLNNDTEVITPDWLEEMVARALRADVGAVGAMLYYPNDTIQHAGVILGLGGVAGHAYLGKPRGEPGQMDRARLAQDLSAVTGACMVMRRSVFEEVDGFDERLAVAFNDVDLCLRVKARGYRILWTPFAELYHHEGISRGRDTVVSERFRREIAFMQARWGALLPNDPAYNPNLTLSENDFSLAFPPRVRKPWLMGEEVGAREALHGSVP